MELSQANVLTICDDAALAAKIDESVKSSVKSYTLAKTEAEAKDLASKNEYDAFILRTSTPILSNPSGLFFSTQHNKKMKKAPWIVLGRDIEDEQIIIHYNFFKFTNDAQDTSTILTIMKGLFSTGTSASGKPVIDLNFLNPIVAAVKSVVESMSSIKMERGAPYIRKGDDGALKDSIISGIIAMNSNRFLGSMSITYDEQLIKTIYKNMMGEDVKDINDDVKDCVSEMTNIIFGNAKRDLNAVGHTITPALPSVITGKNHDIRHSVAGVVLAIPFSTAHGMCLVECVTASRE